MLQILVVILLLINTAAEAAVTSCKPGRFDFGSNNSDGEKRAAFDRRLVPDFLRTVALPSNNIENENNGDEQTVPDAASQFTKTFTHDPTTGLVDATGLASYQQLVKAINDGQQADFNAIVRAPGASKLVNPQAALAFSLQGADTSLFSIPLFPTMSSPELAAQMIEDYLMVLCRDVVFSDYGTGLGTDTPGLGASASKTNDAAAVLQSLGAAYSGPRNNVGVVDASVIFRCNGYGAKIGPMVSQFLLLPIKTNAPALLANTPPFLIFNQQRPIAQTREFNITFSDFVAIQNGTTPRPYLASDYDPVNAHYISRGRDGGSYVHWDVDYEAFYNAATILAQNGFPFSSALPYVNGNITNEAPFGTMGVIDVFGLIGGVATEAIKAAWAQKWRANRACRPEGFSGIVNRVKVTGLNPFNLDNSLFVPHAGVDVLANILAHNQAQAGLPGNSFTVGDASTYLLAQMYPEGSPAHPTYPEGHGAISGACITVIKAIFEDTTLLNTKFAPVKPTPGNPTTLTALTPGEGSTIMTVASELDKLASNIAMARNWAGVHYRADADQGILLGEQVAIKYLQDHACIYMEQGFTGFTITKLDGTRIRITSTSVTPI